MANKNLSLMQKKTKTNIKKKTVVPCPICNKELHLNHEFTQRVGILDDFDEIIGWMCPYCKSRFDIEENITYISLPDSKTGKA